MTATEARPETQAPTGTFAVRSEVGRLREVIVHRPEVEPAGAQHDQFAQQLTSHGVVVHHYARLLVEALDADGAREFLAERLATPERFGLLLAGAIDDIVRTYPATRLADVLIGGLAKRDMGDSMTTPSLLLATAGPDDFVLPPLPTHLFQRDSSAWIYDAVTVNPMAQAARQRETLSSRVIYGFHPMFAATAPTFLYGNDSAVHIPATVEGGDIAVLGHRSVMIGMGKRTTPQGVELLAHRLFETGTADHVIVVELPKGEAFVHLDSALTQVDRDTYSVHPHLPERLRSWRLKPALAHSGLAFHQVDDLFHELSFALQVDQVRVLKVPRQHRAADGEWDDGHGVNFLALEPGVVMGREGNTATNDYLAAHGIKVVPVAGLELGRGRGGPRCLTCPIQREG